MKLTKDEKKLADDFASGKFKKKKDDRNFAEFGKQAKNSRINLRLQDDVLEYFQSLAKKEGIPYQTLISGALFKVASGQLVESHLADLSKQVEELKRQISELNLKKEA